MVDNFLEEWIASNEDSQLSAVVGFNIELHKPIFVTGICDRHLGPRWEYAKVKIKFQHSSSVLITSEVPLSEDLNKLKALTQIAYGIFDIAVPSCSRQDLNIHAIVTEIEIDPIETTANSIRLAAQDATRKAFCN